ncbi:hypothetical protein QYF36_004886 [Acer negundo]|nr:hypothetical protein QYF36_004886 [Acer negundo]
MKLGINLQTGHKWFLQSWLTDNSPVQGSFTLGMNPNVSNQLTIWWQGKVCRTSGIWLNGDFNYSDYWGVNNYNFSYTSNEQETKGVLYFNLKYELMSGDGFKFKESDNMTSTDCQLKCQSSCFAYAITNRENGTGTKFIKAHKGNYREIYMEVEPKEENWWLSLTIAIGIALVIPRSVVLLMLFGVDKTQGIGIQHP